MPHIGYGNLQTQNHPERSSIMSELNHPTPEKELPLGRAVTLLISTIFLGFVFDVLFYSQIPQLSFFLFTVAFYIVYFTVSQKLPSLKLEFENFLFLSVLLLAITFFLHTNNMLLGLNLLIVPGLIMTHTQLMSRKNNHPWHTFLFLPEAAIGALTALFQNLGKPFSVLLRLRRRPDQHQLPSTGKKVLFGILVAVPFLIFSIHMLASADAVFNRFITQFTKVFQNFEINSLFAQTMLILFIFFFSFSYLYSMLENKKTVKLTVTPQGQKLLPGFDPIVILTVLILLSVLYFAFTIIQFTYLFGSIKLALPAGMTYADYARSGFFQLVAVTFMNVLLILFSVSRVKASNPSLSFLLTTVNSLLVVFTFILLFSAHFRMNLYQRIYGTTELRLVTHYFMLYLAIVLLLLLLWIFRPQLCFGKCLVLLTLFAYVTLNFMNVDKIIVKDNIAQYHKNHKFDVAYAQRLSYDTVPQLIHFCEDTRSSDPALSSSLYKLLRDKADEAKQYKTFQSYNYSIERAKRLLENF